MSHKNLRHIVAYHRDSDTTYIGNVDATAAASIWTTEIEDAYVFKTEEELRTNKHHYMRIRKDAYEMIFTEMPDIEELMVI